MEYFEIYRKRLNRYGTNYQDRVQNQREKAFELRLMNSIYRVDASYYPNNDENQLPVTIPATLERASQTNTETLQYLCTTADIQLPGGTILKIPREIKKTNPPQPESTKEKYEQSNYPPNGERKYEINYWMVFYPEEIQTSGYNKYIVLKMTHFLKWKDRNGNIQESRAYMYGQQDNMLKDEIRSRSRMDTIYSENLKGSFFVMPANAYIRKDDYIEVTEGVFTESYRVTGYDIQSTKGVEYVTVDPIYEYDKTKIEIPSSIPEEEQTEYFWLKMDRTKVIEEEVSQ